MMMMMMMMMMAAKKQEDLEDAGWTTSKIGQDYQQWST